MFGQVLAADYASPTPDVLTTAIGDMLNAYNVAKGRTPEFVNRGGGELGGLTLQPGVYGFNTPVTISSNLVLQGDCNAVFIFQVP